MTSLGKTLVMINLFLSIAVATWALGIYNDRIDWSDAPASKDKPTEGELVRRKARIKELTDPASGALAVAARSWNASRSLLARLDKRRTTDQAWYEQELAFDRNLATRANPARVIKLANGQPVPINAGIDDRPVMEPGRDTLGKPFQSLVAYTQAEESLQQQIDTETKNLARLHDEDAQLTNQLVGDGGALKGLQQRVLDERAKLAEAINEQRFVQPLLINAAVNSELVITRQHSLEARIKELQKTGVASR
jgi:hypothetical protein